MERGDLDHLAAFAAIAEARSFTKAAARLGISQSALSHAFKAFEERLGVALLARTSRSVAPTTAGEQLLRSLGPAFGEIEAALEGLQALRDEPSGSIRITATSFGVEMVLRPVLPAFLARYPRVSVEITADDGLTDIVNGRYDAGLRFGEHLARDMVALRVGPDIEPAVVASPTYLATEGTPSHPKMLGAHRCINYRFKTSGALYAWRFVERGRPFEIRVDGPLVVNEGRAIVNGALDGIGIGYVFLPMVREHLAAGRLVRLFPRWCPPFPGFHLYYPSRHHNAALDALVSLLRPRKAARAKVPVSA